MAGADAPGTALPDERNAAGSREAARAGRAGHKADSTRGTGAAAIPPRRCRACEGDYFTTMSVPAWEGTSAQTPVGRSPAFSGAERTDGQP